MANLRATSFIIGPEDRGVGLDGETFGLQIGTFMNDLRISWRGDGTDPWHEITRWAHEMRSWLIGVTAR